MLKQLSLFVYKPFNILLFLLLFMISTNLFASDGEKNSSWFSQLYSWTERCLRSSKEPIKKPFQELEHLLKEESFPQSEEVDGELGLDNYATFPRDRFELTRKGDSPSFQSLRPAQLLEFDPRVKVEASENLLSQCVIDIREVDQDNFSKVEQQSDLIDRRSIRIDGGSNIGLELLGKSINERQENLSPIGIVSQDIETLIEQDQTLENDPIPVRLISPKTPDFFEVDLESGNPSSSPSELALVTSKVELDEIEYPSSSLIKTNPIRPLIEWLLEPRPVNRREVGISGDNDVEVGLPKIYDSDVVQSLQVVDVRKPYEDLAEPLELVGSRLHPWIEWVLGFKKPSLTDKDQQATQEPKSHREIFITKYSAEYSLPATEVMEELEVERLEEGAVDHLVKVQPDGGALVAKCPIESVRDPVKVVTESEIESLEDGLTSPGVKTLGKKALSTELPECIEVASVIVRPESKIESLEDHSIDYSIEAYIPDREALEVGHKTGHSVPDILEMRTITGAEPLEAPTIEHEAELAVPDRKALAEPGMPAPLAAGLGELEVEPPRVCPVSFNNQLIKSSDCISKLVADLLQDNSEMINHTVLLHLESLRLSENKKETFYSKSGKGKKNILVNIIKQIKRKNLLQAKMFNTTRKGFMENSDKSVFYGLKKGYFWAKELSFGHKETRRKNATLESQTTGLISGISYCPSEGFIIGTGYGRYSTLAELDKQNIKVDNNFFTSYGSWYNDRFFLESSILIGKLKYTTRRKVAFSQMNPMEMGKYNGFEVAPKLRFGWSFKVNKAIFSPFVSADFTYNKGKNYVSMDSTLKSHLINKKQNSALYKEVGIKISKEYRTKNSRLTPTLSLSYINKKHYSQKSSSKFLNRTDKIQNFKNIRHQVNPGIALTFETGNGLYCKTNISSEVGSKYKKYEFNIKMKLDF